MNLNLLNSESTKDNNVSSDELYSREERKSNGVFYTPNFLAKYLARKILHYCKKNRNAFSILDPACGDSVLLRSFTDELINNGAETISSIYGIDKDINAIQRSKEEFSRNSYKCFKSKFIQTDALFPFNEKNSFFAWEKLREKIHCKEGFDIVLSNPPWGADISEYNFNLLSQNFSLSKGQFDIYDLFVEVVLSNLTNNGIYGLILPDSIFSQEQSQLRFLLSNKTSILLIARLGEKIFNGINRACVVVIGRKAIPPFNHSVDCFRLSSSLKKMVLSNELELEEVENRLIHKVPQSRFLQNDNCVFDIDLKIDEQNTFNKIQNTSNLIQKVVKNARGAEISKKGLVCQCDNCSFWLPYPKAKLPKCIHCKTILDLNTVKTDKIILNHNGHGNLRLKVGEDLYRFTSISKSWIDTLKEGINYKDSKIYEGAKILVRKTGVGITASIDYENSITNQVVYILKLKPEFINRLSLEFVLSVLNSRLITYYLIKKYGENEWKSHPYLTQKVLVNLPFPDIDFNSKKQSQLIKKITKIVQLEVLNSKDKNITKDSDLEIERTIAYFFNLNKYDYDVIFKTLHAAEQLIPIKRLLNCSSDEIFKVNGI